MKEKMIMVSTTFPPFLGIEVLIIKYVAGLQHQHSFPLGFQDLDILETNAVVFVMELEECMQLPPTYLTNLNPRNISL